MASSSTDSTDRAAKAARTGVVLAAGFGSRLAGTAAATDLKPLTPVAGMPLIVRTLRSLEQAGCRRAVIVLGYQPETLRAGIEEVYTGPLDLVFTINEHYDRQNGLSLLSARPALHEAADADASFVLVMADHVLGDEIMALARRCNPAPGHAALLVDYKLDAIFDMDDATKVRVAGGRVQAIGKALADFNAVDTGVFVGTNGLLEAVDSVCQERGDASLSDGVRLLASSGRMDALDIEDGFWQDVDTPAMLQHATTVLEEREQALS